MPAVEARGLVLSALFLMAAAVAAAAASSMEVVGGAGRVGSFWLRQPGARPVPRGVSPGYRTTEGSPIVVCTPSSAWHEVLALTPAPRRSDLCFCGNGLPPPHFDGTAVVPHFAVLEPGVDPVAAAGCPPTLLWGRHADRLAAALERAGVPTTVVASAAELRYHAARKLLWSSLLWLLCHETDPPRTVGQVHKACRDDLVQLLEEIVPAVEAVLAEHRRGEGEGDDDDLVRRLLTLPNVLDYLQQYSRSMPSVVPSRRLALRELPQRHGVWLTHRDACPQPRHETLLARVGGADAIPVALGGRGACGELDPGRRSGRVLAVPELGLRVVGRPAEGRGPCRSAIVVGAGVIGSAIAWSLAQRGVATTVLEAQSSDACGLTTPASWAWLNANQKRPMSYQWLNELGMRGWRQHPVLTELAVWPGSIVQYPQPVATSGGYEVDGPLSTDRIHELEPEANFDPNAGPVYFFPQEGMVDPVVAVQRIREEAKSLGVQFIYDMNVTECLRDANGGRVTGVRAHHTVGQKVKNFCADVVVIAAGVGAAKEHLGGLPMLHQPGTVCFAEPVGKAGPSLRRILVDTVRESHILQRLDGTLVVGGGYLVKGGIDSKDNGAAAHAHANLLERAAALVPNPLTHSHHVRSATADRPIPLDGLPAISYNSLGLYMAVMHSGFTLAGAVGPLIATELSSGLSLDALQEYHPDRLLTRSTPQKK